MNTKTKMLMSFKNTLCNKNRQTQSDMKAWKSVIDQVTSVKIDGHWPRSLFAFLWPSTRRENLANIRAILTELAWSIISKYIVHIYMQG